jgi:Domain of unknown function (DUF3458_C) ARM repeats
MRAAPITSSWQTKIMTFDPINRRRQPALVRPLCAWRRHHPALQALMQSQLERIAMADPGK